MPKYSLILALLALLSNSVGLAAPTAPCPDAETMRIYTQQKQVISNLPQAARQAHQQALDRWLQMKIAQCKAAQQQQNQAADAYVVRSGRYAVWHYTLQGGTQQLVQTGRAALQRVGNGIYRVTMPSGSALLHLVQKTDVSGAMPIYKFTYNLNGVARYLTFQASNNEPGDYSVVWLPSGGGPSREEYWMLNGQ